jgi:ferric-chelate reductase [NAD(P)H]
MDTSALHKLSYGVYIVSSTKDGRYNGQIANTVFQVTGEPPTIAVSINRSNLTWEYIKASRVFAVSALCEATPMVFIGRFGFKSGRNIDKFEGINYKTGVTGAPVVLENTVAYLEGKVINEMDVHTHTIFVAEAVAAEVISQDVCMTYDYYHQIKGGKTPRSAATYIAGQPGGKPG